MKLRTKLLSAAVALAITGAATAQIWGPVVGGFINGGVIYGAGGVAAQDSTKFFWDATNHRLGLGNAAPTVTLDVTGDARVSGTLTPAGTLALTGDFAVNTNKFNVASATGNTTVAGTLGVTGATTLSALTTIDKGSTGDQSVVGHTQKLYLSENGTTIGLTSASANLGTGLTILPGSNTANIIINGSTIFTANASGVSVLGGGASVFTGDLSINGQMIVTTSASPASGAACTGGKIVWDSGYIYVCTASGVWKRAALTGGY